MVGQHVPLPGGRIDVRIDFRRQDAFVTEHFLYDAEVRPVFHQMGGETVPEGVEAGDMLRIRKA